MKSALSNSVLVLNKSWRPIRVSNVRKTLTALSKGLCSILDAETSILYDWEGWLELPVYENMPCIATKHLKVRVPTMAVLSNYNKIPAYSVKQNMKNIWLRDGKRCQYTGRMLSLSEATKDHVIPTSRGGKDSWDNLVTCCPNINKRKGDKTPEEAGLRLLLTPREPKWSPLYSVLYSGEAICSDWLPYLTDIQKTFNADMHKFEV